MKITNSKVTKIKIEDILKSHSLDPISVYLEDFEQGQGKITISCYDKTWSSYWGSMGRTISEFFCSCDHDYLVKNLAGNINSGVIDEEKSIDFLKNRIIECRKGCCENGNTLDSYEAEEAWGKVESIDNVKEWLMSGNELVCKLIGDEWWHQDFPEKENPDYAYLCRIIDTVKEVLKSQDKPIETVTLPKELTAENGAKALLIGKFSESVELQNSEYCGENCSECEDACSIDDQCREESYNLHVPVSWTTIKDIYKKIVKHFEEN